MYFIGTFIFIFRAETEAIWIKAGNETKQVPSLRYRRLLKKREKLMGQFERSEISRNYYLKQMGGLCLKASKESDRLVNDPNLTVGAPVDIALDDSLSETRAEPHSSESDSSVDQDDPYEAQSRRNQPPPPKRKVARKPQGKRPICPICDKGFQLGRTPPLHLNCAKCANPTHKRCTSHDVTVGSFLCGKCAGKSCNPPPSPSAEGSALPSDPLPDAVPAPSPLPSTLEESAEFSSYCGPNKFAKVCSSGPGGAAKNCCNESLLSEDADFQGMWYIWVIYNIVFFFQERNHFLGMPSPLPCLIHACSCLASQDHLHRPIHSVMETALRELCATSLILLPMIQNLISLKKTTCMPGVVLFPISRSK